MNRLSTAQRAQIIAMLVEGMSMRAITRITGVSINTVAKLLNDAGDAAAEYHHLGASRLSTVSHRKEIPPFGLRC